MKKRIKALKTGMEMEAEKMTSDREAYKEKAGNTPGYAYSRNPLHKKSIGRKEGRIVVRMKCEPPCVGIKEVKLPTTYNDSSDENVLKKVYEGIKRGDNTFICKTCYKVMSVYIPLDEKRHDTEEI